MIRTKAKTLLLSIALVMACFVFFACKETKVKVDSATFTEQSISMLVGEQYSPVVKILPSYATDRSYTLISGDVTALSVEGGTITALRAVKGVKLKVVSNENKNINDVVTVDIYAEATTLDAPTNLTFDGTRFSFVGEDDSNASSYILKVGDTEVNIGISTEYKLSDLSSKLGDLNNQVLKCSVKAVGDGKIFKDSNYSNEIEFVKLSSVSNAYIENETLYFDAIRNIASYNVHVLVNGNVVDTKTVENLAYNKTKLSLDVSSLTDSINGAEYVLKITANTDVHNFGQNVEAFANDETSIDYVVIGMVRNLQIANDIISWDFVKNAQHYTVELYKDGSLLETYQNIKSNYRYIQHDEAGEYYYKIIANSSNSNTTSGKVYSNPLNFKILPAPIVSARNGEVKWNSVDKAEGYLVTIKNSGGNSIISNKFVIQSQYDISGFDYGRYSIQVVACGNGGDVVTSKVSASTSWTILKDLQVGINNQKLYWIDNDTSSLHKYNLVFNISVDETVDLTLTDANFNSQYSYDEVSGRYVYDLSSYDFEPNDYQIKLQSLGNENVFNADKNTINITKLAEASIAGMSNQKLTINSVTKGVDYKVNVYLQSDTSYSTPIAELDVDASYNASVNASELDAGNYVAKVFVYGNDGAIFDADNENVGTTYSFEKLAIPTIVVDGNNLKLVVQNLANATSYKLFENGANKPLNEREYILNLVAGDYVYKAQAIGNRANVLDSDITLLGNEVKIKKLATPTIDFDKNSLMYTISCVDKDYVESYDFDINGNGVPVDVATGKANGAGQISNVDTYVAKVYANPKAVNAGYNLVIASATAQHSSYKLAGACDFEIADGVLLVTPLKALNGTGYSLSLRIENGASDIVINDFVYTNSRFETRLYDAKYDLIDTDIEALLKNPGQYALFTTISQNNNNVVDSDEVEIEDKLMALGRVATINKGAQTIEFEVVDNATSYIAVVMLNGREYYIDITGKYATSGTKNILDIETLLELMDSKGVAYLEQVEYSIKFIAVSENDKTIANKGVSTYSFEFLKAPTISISEKADSGNDKWITISNDDSNVALYNIIIKQGDELYDAIWTKSAEEYTYMNLDGQSQFVAGALQIEVNARAAIGNYFESKYSLINATKLDSTVITVNEGMLVWDKVSHAKQYNLTYSHGGVENTISLYEGVENFVISGAQCSYPFDGLSDGLTSFYLQIDSEVGNNSGYYLNSNNGTAIQDIYKLPTLNIDVVDGELYTEIRYSDLTRINRVEILVDGTNVNIDITEEQDDIKLQYSADKLGITINPVLLLKYGTDVLLKETIELKLYAGNTSTLNSTTAVKDVYGLLKPSGLDITTANTTNADGAIDEVIEKITWTNPSANGNYVNNYEIIINYNDVNYVFNTSENAFMMPTYCGYDANENGELDYDEDIDGDGVLDDGEDANGNGILDKVEVVFGAGVYNIKVRALTNNAENILNSKYCEEISITVLATPTNLTTKNGNVIWSSDVNVENYLIKVYLLTYNDQLLKTEKELITSTQSKVSECDLNNLPPFEKGVYGISVQAMHSNSRILSSKESEVLQVIRLPQVTSYFVKDGELYINAHSFFTKAEVYLTDKTQTPTTYTFTINNTSLSGYNTYVEGMDNWLMSDVLSTYEYSEGNTYYSKAKYTGDGATLKSALAEAYTIQVKLFGNSVEDGHGAIISGHASEAINLSLQDNDLIVNKNLVTKLVTPNTTVSQYERGKFLLNIPDGITYAMSYYKDEDGNSLQGVHLYQINVSVDKIYMIYVAEIVDDELFKASLAPDGANIDELTVEDLLTTENSLKHFTYNGRAFNVIDKNAEGYMPFDFNVNKYYYYNISGVYSEIVLENGGSFIVNAMLMGDDTQFIKSNISKNATVKRYNMLNVAVENGKVSWTNQATEQDHPIYLITLTNQSETYNLVLYNPSVHNVDELAGCLEEGKDYIYDTITYNVNVANMDKRIVYSNITNIVDRARRTTGLGGTFLATIRAHYTNNSSTDIILAQGAESKTITILPQSKILLNNGLLTWNMSQVSKSDSSEKESITNYMLEVFNAEMNSLYTIKLTDGDYSVAEGRATFELPKTLDNKEGATFDFVENSNYVFKLTALGDESTTYVDSTTSNTDTVTLLPKLENVKMQEGVLIWTNPTTNNVEISISYKLGDATINYVTTTAEAYFELPTSFTDTSGTAREFVAGYDYTIKARLLGDNKTLNGFFGDGVLTQRLTTINKDANANLGTIGIATDNGLLKWQKVEAPSTIADYYSKLGETVGPVTYSIDYALGDGTTGTIADIETNEYAFASLPGGVINVTIKAHNDKCYTSSASAAVKLFKLGVPTNIIFNPGTTTISWDKVLDSNNAEVNDYIVSIRQEGLEDKEYYCNNNQWIIKDVVSNEFSIAVKATSIDSAGTLINSEFTSYQPMSLPNKVDVETFKFDTDLQAFKWKAISDESEGDKYYITYSYAEPDGEVFDPKPSALVTQSMEIEGEKWYFYRPSAIGKYTLVSVQVVRAQSLSSQPTRCVNEDGTDVVLNFDLFASGNGVDKPYIISDETHLRNIKYFLNANYELDAHITLESGAPITDSTQIFTGTINGNSKEIRGTTRALSNFSSSGYEGLFNKVAGATFANITLSGFTLNGYLNSTILHMGVLVAEADGYDLGGGSIRQTKFINIKIVSTKINLIKDNVNGINEDRVNVYAGAIVGRSNNTTFEGCEISLGNANANDPDVMLTIKGGAFTNVAFGGLAGYAEACTITSTTANNNIAFVVKHELSSVQGNDPNIYLGSLIGMADDATTSSGNSCGFIECFSNKINEKTNEMGNKN